MNLQEILLALYNAGEIPYSDLTIIDRLAEEHEKGYFGSATGTLVKTFREQHAIGDGSGPEVVNMATAEALTAQFQALPVSGRVSGVVTHVSGKPLSGVYKAYVYRLKFRDKILLPGSPANLDEQGAFSFTFDPSILEASDDYANGYRAIIQLQGSTEILATQTIYTAGLDIRFDKLVIESSEVPVISEFEDVISSLNKAIGEDASIADIDINDPEEMQQLIEQSGEQTKTIAPMVQAYQLHEQISGIATTTFYALLRQHLSPEPAVLAAQPVAVLERALSVSVAANIIPLTGPAEIHSIAAAIPGLLIQHLLYTVGQQSPEENGFNRTVLYVLDNNQAQAAEVLDAYNLYYPADEAAFWERITHIGLSEGKPEQLKRAIGVTTFTGNNYILNRRLLLWLNGTPEGSDPGNPDSAAGLKQLAILSLSGWNTIVTNAAANPDFFYPEFITGENATAKNAAYATYLYEQVQQAYPTHSFMNTVTLSESTSFDALKSSLEPFTVRNPEFDFRTVSIEELKTSDKYSFADVTGDKNTFIDEIATVQRLMAVSGSYPVINELAKNELKSSLHIVQQPREDFVTAYAGVAGNEDLAAGVYESAQNNVLFLMNLAIDAQQEYSDPGFAVLNKGTGGSSGTAYAEWRALFGPTDGCNCSHCQSIYSPSAYLTDLLYFLKTNHPVLYTTLNTRRPDIRNIELTCKNTNTPVPHIDVVNELLEDLVGMQDPNATPAAAPYIMYARTTKADAKLQRAIPEYVNVSTQKMMIWDDTLKLRYLGATVPTPYGKLKDAVYPWSLPYNFYKRQIDTHLDLVDVSGHELSQRFGPFGTIPAWDDLPLCATYIGLTNTELGIIDQSGVSNPTYVYYGLKVKSQGTLLAVRDPQNRAATYPSGPFTFLNWQEKLSFRVDVFLQQTGLAYTELLELLDCYVINPLFPDPQLPDKTYRKIALVANGPDVLPDSCRLDQLMISNADERFFDLVYRFVRLKRALGWTYYELDQAMLATSGVAPTSIVLNGDTVKRMAQIKYLTKELRLPVQDIVSFWRDLDFNFYRNYQKSEPEDFPSEYERLYRNPAVGIITAIGYPFSVDTIPHTFIPEVSFLAGIFKIAGSELQVLLDKYQIAKDAQDKITLNRAQLSLLRRQALLMNSLELTATDLLRYQAWIAADTPDTSVAANAFTAPLTTIRFADLVRQSRRAAISTDQIDYLLNDKTPNAVDYERIDEKAVKTLTGLRSELKKKSLPEYDETTDTTGKELEALLLRVMDKDNAGYLVKLIQNDPGITDTDLQRQDFLTARTAFFLSGADQQSVTDIGVSSETRRGNVFTALREYVEENILKPAAITYLSKELKISEEVTRAMLLDCLNAPDDFTEIGFVNGDTVPSNAQVQFHTYCRLYKASLLVNAYKLRINDVLALWKDATVFPDILQLTALPVTGSAITTLIPIRKWINFLKWMEVRHFLGSEMDLLYTVIGNTPATFASGAAKQDVLDRIRIAFKMGQEDIRALLGIDHQSGGILQTNLTDNADYHQPALYLRLIDCLEIQHSLPSPMITLGKIAAATQQAAAQGDANAVIQAVKSQYDEQQWPDVIRKANDLMRTERRDALVAFLLANPSRGYEQAWVTANDIYETMMVDVEMMSCMSTTRVLLAINTIQLWVNRILMGLEPDPAAPANKLTLSKDESRQWHAWRRLYRVWEANRKVFIYPENWIEPELRDDKSPFFKELEKFLKQNDLTEENVVDAYKTYLERLEQVANLEIMGHYPEEVRDSTNQLTDTIMHVWGRTPANPHLYFYRKRVAGVWSAWEKMDVQIDSNSFAPVMHRGQLRLYWLTLSEEENAENFKANEDEIIPKKKSLIITLNWTELKNGKWLPLQIGKEVLKTEMDGPLRGKDVVYHYTKPNSYTSQIKAYTVRSFNDSFEGLKDSLMPYAIENGDHDMEIIVLGRKKYVTHEDVNRQINLSPKAPDPMDYDAYYSKAEECYFSNSVKTETFRGRFTVKRGKVYTDKSNLPRTYFDTLIETTFPIQAVKSRYTYAMNRVSGYGHMTGTTPAASTPLLGLAPAFSGAPDQNKYIVTTRVVPGNVSANLFPLDTFIYQDYKNCFFVEKGTTIRTRLNPTGTVYTFQNFRHSKVEDFQNRLYHDGLENLLQRTFITGLTNDLDFNNTYAPTSYVNSFQGTYLPTNSVDFRESSPTSLYNWELFFHIPMLIANKLMQDQKFEEARKWYHFVFDPTVGDAGSVADFWNYPVFYDNANTIVTPQTLMSDPNLQAAVDRWANNPFKPHLIARTRVSAYMKNVVMKYLDNLIGWGDALFRTDTRENINEATLLYVLAAQLLGRRPEQMPARATPKVQVFASLESAGFNAFSNALVKLENRLVPSTAATHSGRFPAIGGSMYYFCIPPNDKMTTYWDTIADRLFKIRNCRNIDGTERELALFDPPIDPALLVRATAAGISLSDVLNNINAPLPFYRFNVMSQKATELAQEVKSLGGQLLSALEKKDAEHLSLLRSGQEVTMLNLVTEVREQQVAESASQIKAVQQQQVMTTQRRDYYKRLIEGGLNVQEQLQLETMMDSIPLARQQGTLQTLSGLLYAFPQIKAGVFNFGVETGGQAFGAVIGAAASAIGTTANVQSIGGNMAAVKGGFARRKEEWQLQLSTSETELKQLDQQLIAAQIRNEIAVMELRNHQTQLAHAQEMDETMRNKYTNEELYEWMTSELSLTYFQAYKLALDLAKKAERCYNHELGLSDGSFIQPAYWDSLKKGLLAGEQLMFDIKRMEAAYLDKNKRHLELTKHISLAAFAPDKLMELKTNKKCDVLLPEWLFDMDYPGHHLRRIKSVSLSIPCVAGPYTTISCKLSLVNSKYRETGVNKHSPVYDSDDQYKQLYGSIQSIATSHAQNDSGMFEFSFRDERYLPFEGAGAISTWHIELPSAFAAQFDHDSISDVIIHMNYTALDEGSLAGDSAANVLHRLNVQDGFMRLFSMKREFSNEWYAYGQKVKTVPNAPLTIYVDENRLPLFARGQKITTQTLVQLIPKTTLDGTYKMEVSYRDESGDIIMRSYTLNESTAVDYRGAAQTTFTINGNARILRMVLRDNAGTPVNMDEVLDDVVLILYCKADEPADENVPDDTDWGMVSDLSKNTMTAWWSAGSGLVKSGTQVTTWKDQSGKQQDLVPESLGTAPVIDTNVVNGIAPLVFSGGEALYTGDFQDTDNFTATVLVNITATADTGLLGRNIGNGESAGWALWMYQGFYTPMSATNSGYDPDYHNMRFAPATGDWELITIRRNAAAGQISLWRDGQNIGTYTCGHTFYATNMPISIGSLGHPYNYGHFKMLEAVIHDQALTDAEIATQHQYLSQKYDLQLSF